MLASQAKHETVLWDVVGEHLDEAEFALERWRDALASWQYTLDEIARGPEEQLLAHLDALLIAGAPVAEKLLAPELDAPEEPSLDRSTVAALTLLAAGQREAVWNALAHKEPVVARAAAEAFVLSTTPHLDSWLPSQFAPGAPLPAERRTVLLDIAARRGLVLPGVVASLQASDPEEVLAAVVAARATDGARHLPALEPLLDHPDLRVRAEAMVSALCHGSLHAWQRCTLLAASPKAPGELAALAMQLVALLGEPRQQQVLVDHLARPSHRALALAALAFSGQAAVIPAILPHLRSDDAIVAGMASHAYATITGVDTSVAPYAASGEPVEDDDAEGLPPLEDDDLDADLVAEIEPEELPLPDPQAIQAHWQQHGATYDTRRRLLGGVPWTLTSCLDQIDRASMLVRAPLVRWLLVRSGGFLRIPTHAFSGVQRAYGARARGATEQSLGRRYGGW